MKVLLQDQDDGMRALIRPMLAGHHVSVIEAKNAWDVPAMVARHEPDVVLLSAADIYGPGRDVPDVLASRSGRPRLLLLGAMEPRSAQAPRLPVDGYLPYPFEAERLLAAIDWVLQACAPRPAAVHAQSPLAAAGAMVAAAISSPTYFECRAAGGSADRLITNQRSASRWPW
ncbi:MAG TPA: hypothetical protein VMW62_03690 [Chloroflexota bacterium]|nr:hypothetical protein [Chloroflexota bacterium]